MVVSQESPGDESAGGPDRRRLLLGLGALGVAGAAGGGFAAGRATAPPEPAPLLPLDADLAEILEPFRWGLLCPPAVYAREWTTIRSRYGNAPGSDLTGTVRDLQTSSGVRLSLCTTAVFAQLLAGDLPPAIDQDAFAQGMLEGGGYLPNQESLDQIRRGIVRASVGGYSGTEILWADQCVIGLAVVHHLDAIDVGFKF